MTTNTGRCRINLQRFCKFEKKKIQMSKNISLCGEMNLDKLEMNCIVDWRQTRNVVLNSRHRLPEGTIPNEKSLISGIRKTYFEADYIFIYKMRVVWLCATAVIWKFQRYEKKSIFVSFSFYCQLSPLSFPFFSLSPSSVVSSLVSGGIMHPYFSHAMFPSPSLVSSLILARYTRTIVSTDAIKTKSSHGAFSCTSTRNSHICDVT